MYFKSIASYPIQIISGEITFLSLSELFSESFEIHFVFGHFNKFVLGNVGSYLVYLFIKELMKASSFLKLVELITYVLFD